jgi:transposase-like protein
MHVPGVPTPEHIKILLTRAVREGMDQSVQKKLQVILHFAEHAYSISETCRQFQMSRSTFHRWMERFDPEDLSTLEDKFQSPLGGRQSVVDAKTTELIRLYRTRDPQVGKERLAEIFLKEHALHLSPSSIGRVIERECFYFADTPLHWKKRIAHAEQHVFPEQEATEVLETRELPSEDVKIVPQERSTPTQSLRNRVKRIVIVSTVVTNIIFVMTLIGMTLIEYRSMPLETDQTTTPTLHAAPTAEFLP